MKSFWAGSGSSSGANPILVWFNCQSIFLYVFNQCLRLIIAPVRGGEISIINEKRFWGFSRLFCTLSLLIFHRVIYCKGVCQMAEIVQELRRAVFLAEALTVSQPALLRSLAVCLRTLLLCSHSDVRCVLVNLALGQFTLANSRSPAVAKQDWKKT